MRRRISLRQIEGFLLASEHLSFIRASEEMNITQSAFSQLIRELEYQIGVQLFDRTTRRVLLTAAGESMRLKMKRGISAIDDACEEAKAIGRVDRGHIRLGALSSLAIGIAVRTLKRLRAEFPGVTVSMQEGLNDSLVALLASGGIDITIGAEIVPTPGLTFEPLFDDELVIVTEGHSPLAQRERVRWEDLTNERLVLPPRSTSMRESVVEKLSAHQMSISVDYEAGSVATTLSMVRAGFGSTFISHITLNDLPTQGLAVVRVEDPPIRRMGMYRRADRKPSLASQKFAELLFEEVSAVRKQI